MMTRYKAVVESGSCSMDLDADRGRRWEEKTDCGHLHKTREAAVSCDGCTIH